MEKILPIIIIVLVFINYLIIFSRYRRCPADKLMVIYGRVGNDKDGKHRSFVCIHGGAAFIWPIIQSYEYLDLNPIIVEIDFNALSKNNISIDIDAKFTIGISVEEGIRENAVERLLGISHEDIRDLTQDILIGALRSLVKNKDAVDINLNSDVFMSEVINKVNDELNKIGITLINFRFNRISTLGGVSEKQDLTNITGQKLYGSKINKIELVNDNIIFYLNKQPEINVIIKCIDYIDYNLLGNRNNLTVSQIFISNSQSIKDNKINIHNMTDKLDSNWKQIQIKLNGVEMNVACKQLEVYY